MANFGYSFQPGPQSVPLGQSSPKPMGGPQSAIQIKSLSLPQREIQGAPASLGLLTGAGANGTPEAQLLRQLVAAFAPQGQQPAAPQLASNMSQMLAPNAPAGTPDHFSTPSAPRPYDPADYGRADNGPQDYAQPVAAPPRSNYGVNFSFEHGGQSPQQASAPIAVNAGGFGNGGTIKPPDQFQNAPPLFGGGFGAGGTIRQPQDIPGFFDQGF